MLGRSRYYNNAAIRGGWSFNQSPAVTSDTVPTAEQCIAVGREIFNAQQPGIQQRITNAAQSTGTGQDDMMIGIAVLSMLDSLKMSATVDGVANNTKLLYKTRYLVLKRRWAGVVGSEYFRKLTRIFHTRDLARLRQPAMLPGPYVPYGEIEYFPTPSRRATYTRQGQRYPIDLSTGNWTTLAPAFNQLPPAAAHGHGPLTAQERAILGRATRDAWQQIRALRGGPAAAAAAPMEDG